MRFKRCACPPSKWPECPHAVWVKVKRIKIQKKPIRISLEDYFDQPGKIRGRGAWSEAKKWERRFIEAVENGQYTKWKAEQSATQAVEPATATEVLTITQARDLFKADILDANKYWGTNEAFFARLVRLWDAAGTRPLTEIALADPLALLDPMRRNECAANTIHIAVAQIHRWLRWAVRKGHLAAIPWKKADLNLPPKGDARSQLLTVEDELALRHAGTMDPFLEDLVNVALATGLRRNSLRQIQFSDLRLREGKWGTLYLSGVKMKGRKGSVKRLTERSRASLDRRCKSFEILSPETYLFGKSDGTAYEPGSFRASDWWADAWLAAGLPDTEARPNFHDLRATAACRLYKKTKDVWAVMRFLDHRSLEMTIRYLRAHLGELEEVADAMAAVEAETGTDLLPRPGGTKRGTSAQRAA